jgi:hypothetical protein
VASGEWRVASEMKRTEQKKQIPRANFALGMRSLLRQASFLGGHSKKSTYQDTATPAEASASISARASLQRSQIVG